MNKYDVVTLFPEVFSALDSGILKKQSTITFSR